MSELSRNVFGLRNRNSLQHLARKLDLSAKQIARYCDKGWIPQSLKTPAGHRRIRYDCDTVYETKMLISAAKETERYIREHQNTVTYFGRRVVPWIGCRSMKDLEKRALAAGLSPRRAQAFAYTARTEAIKSQPDILDLALAACDTSKEDLIALDREYDSIPIYLLLGPQSKEDFRRRARKAWHCVLNESDQAENWRKLPRRIRVDGRSESLSRIRLLLLQPDLETFAAAFAKATEVATRMFSLPQSFFLNAKKAIQMWPQETRLEMAAAYIRQRQISPSAAALAEVLGISRSALYRMYGCEVIQSTLRSSRREALPPVLMMGSDGF